MIGKLSRNMSVEEFTEIGALPGLGGRRLNLIFCEILDLHCVVLLGPCLETFRFEGGALLRAAHRHSIPW